MFKIIEITKEEANKIIETKEPLGLFWLEDDGKFIAIYNSTEYGLIEEFNNKEECLQWLKDWFKKPDIEYLKTLSVELYGNRKVYYNLLSNSIRESYDNLCETMDERRETFNNIWDILKKQRAIDEKRKAEGIISNSEALESSKELLKYLESRLEYAKQEKQRIQIQYNIYDTMLNGTIKEINRISTLINNLKENIKLSEESWKAHKGE
ncbi:hypothetical protein ACYSNL_02045 [Enterococcus cecorum]